jgi:hypothetical protein
MSALTAGFSAFSPSYENIANRMSRLKYSRSSQNITQIRPNSARKVDPKLFTIDTRENSPYQPRRRVSPSGLALLDQQIASTGDQFTGKVARNTGIKKYNQRQLKDIGEGKASVHLKTEGNLERGSALYSIDNWTAPRQEKVDVRRVEVIREGGKVSCNLIPGRIYRKEALATLLA